MNVTKSKNGSLLDPNAIANPCGKLAKSFPNGNLFTDLFRLIYNFRFKFKSYKIDII
jgi:hypothetical protein